MTADYIGGKGGGGGGGGGGGRNRLEPWVHGVWDQVPCVALTITMKLIIFMQFVSVLKGGGGYIPPPPPPLPFPVTPCALVSKFLPTEKM